MGDLDDIEEELDLALDALDPVERNRRVYEAEQKRYREQKREFEASIKRRARLNKGKP